MILLLYPIYFGFAIKNSLHAKFSTQLNTSNILEEHIFSNNNGKRALEKKLKFYLIEHLFVFFSKGLGLLVLTILVASFLFWDQLCINLLSKHSLNELIAKKSEKVLTKRVKENIAWYYYFNLHFYETHFND